MKKVALLLMLITIISKILGLLRDIVLSYYYGASSISDVFIIATTITTVIYSFIIKAISTTYIPMYRKVENNDGVSGSLKFTNNLLNVIILFSVAMIVVGLFFTPQLVFIFASGFSPEEFQLAITFTRISLLGIIFTALVFLFSGYLNMKNSFIVPTIIGFPLNLFTLISIYLSHEYKLEILIIGSTLAIGSQLLVLIPFAIKKGYRYQFTLNFRDPNLKNLIWIALPVMLGVSINQINVLVDRTIASQIVTGGISALNYANKINLLVQGIFVVTISTVIYPLISRMAIEKNYSNLKIITRKSIDSIVLFVIPSSIGAMFFSKPIIEVLFLRGEFNQEAYLMTASALYFYSIGMIGFGLREVLSRVFYPLQDSKTPMVNAALGLLLNIVLNVIFSHYWGISGLALATSVAAIFTTCLLYLNLAKRLEGLYLKQIMINFTKVVISSLLVGYIGLEIYKLLLTISNATFSLLIAITFCVISYALLIKVLKLEGLEIIIQKKFKF